MLASIHTLSRGLDVRPEAIEQLFYLLRPLYVGEVAAAGHRHCLHVRDYVCQPDEVIWGSADIGFPASCQDWTTDRAPLRTTGVRCGLGSCDKAGRASVIAEHTNDRRVNAAGYAKKGDIRGLNTGVAPMARTLAGPPGRGLPESA